MIDLYDYSSKNLEDNLLSFGFKKELKWAKRGKPVSAGSYPVTYYSHPGITKYGFCTCEKLGIYYIFDTGDLFEITMVDKEKSLKLSIPKPIKDLYYRDYDRLYSQIEDSIQEKELISVYRSKSKDRPNINHVTQAELKSILFLEKFTKKVNSNPIMSFIYTIWQTRMISKYSESLMKNKLMGLIPHKAGLHLTTSKGLNAILKCEKCDNLFVTKNLSSFIGTKELCEICQAGSSINERNINQLIRIFIIPKWFEYITEYERQYKVWTEQCHGKEYMMDFLLEMSAEAGVTNPHLIIEVDGSWHNDPKNISDDYDKQLSCERLGYTVLRVRDKSVVSTRKTRFYDTYIPGLSEMVREIDTSSRLIDFDVDIVDKILNKASGSHKKSDVLLKCKEDLSRTKISNYLTKLLFS